MKNWFATLNARERAIVVGGGALAALVLIYIAAVEPMWEALEARRARVQSQVELLAWMERSAAEVRAFKTSAGADAQSASRRAPYLQVDASIRRLGLPSPTRLEPRGQSGARAQFESVDFDKLMRMLGEMESNGLRITDISISRRDIGVVSANMTLSREP